MRNGKTQLVRAEYYESCPLLKLNDDSIEVDIQFYSYGIYKEVSTQCLIMMGGIENIHQYLDKIRYKFVPSLGNSYSKMDTSQTVYDYNIVYEIVLYSKEVSSPIASCVKLLEYVDYPMKFQILDAKTLKPFPIY